MPKRLCNPQPPRPLRDVGTFKSNERKANVEAFLFENSKVGFDTAIKFLRIYRKMPDRQTLKQARHWTKYLDCMEYARNRLAPFSKFNAGERQQLLDVFEDHANELGFTFDES